MRAQHTPGPWTISKPADRENSFAYSIRRADGWVVAEVCKWPNDAEAIARLIAKAPAMRELLADLCLTYPHVAEDYRVRELLARIDGNL